MHVGAQENIYLTNKYELNLNQKKQKHKYCGLSEQKLNFKIIWVKFLF